MPDGGSYIIVNGAVFANTRQALYAILSLMDEHKLFYKLIKKTRREKSNF